MTTALDALFSITMGSLLTAGAILLIRLLFRPLLSPKAKYYLWLLLALRLVLPTLPESPTSLLNLLPKAPAVSSTVFAPAPPSQIIFLQEEDSPAAVPEAPEMNRPTASAPDTPQKAPNFPWETLVFVLWLTGAGIGLGIYLVLYLLTYRALARLPLCQDGVLTELTTGETSYETTITLGGYELAATYWFTPSVLTYELDAEPILREVHVDAPEGVPVSQWISSFISPYMSRMWQRDTNLYSSLTKAGDLYTEAQLQALQEAFVQAGYQNQSPETWPLVTCWYDAGQFKFNATGYCLYQDAVNFLP